VDYLAANASRLAGVAIYNIFPDHPITQFLPDELAQLPILLVPSPVTPHEILASILSDEIGLFTAGGMVSSMSDLGIALDFSLTLHSEIIEKRPLGVDMFSEDNAAVVKPLVDGCECFTCKNHHRAYIHHLLKCHEMTAWVLLQMYSLL
jgi:queuine tRNA-ribosyltransferase subunit QTRTD1